jgi:hypothetical protein
MPKGIPKGKTKLIDELCKRDELKVKAIVKEALEEYLENRNKQESNKN